MILNLSRLISSILLLVVCGQNNPISAQGKGKGNNPPVIDDIPDQIILVGDTFPAIDLNHYITEPNGDQVEWSTFQNNNLNSQETQNWSYNNQSPSMIILAKVKIRGTQNDASGDKLAAFHNGKLKGEAEAQLIGTDEWRFFMVIDGEQTYDSIYFKYYDADQTTIFDIDKKILFVSQLVLGSESEPFEMNAGFVSTEISEDPNPGILSLDIYEPNWIGKDTIFIVAREVGTTEMYADTAMIVFRVLSAPLPLELISFSGNIINGHSHLQWQVANPENVEGYEIQRSVPDGSGSLNWEPIGFISHSNQQSHYFFIDSSPYRHVNYYRLKIKDWDEYFEFSNVVSLVFEDQENYEVNVFPNPTMTDQPFFISVKTESPTLIQLQIFNQFGLKMYEDDFQSKGVREHIPIEIEKYKSGVYFAKVKIGNQDYVKSFVVTRS